MKADLEHLRASPAATYLTDADGRLTFYNDAAARLWGHRPEIGVQSWCGSWRLYSPDGTPLPHDQCPMAVALKRGLPQAGQEAVAERPDGSRVPFLAFPGILKDASGRVTGAINTMIDISDRKQAELAAASLAAIVSSSDDAIVSKTLDGIVTSWNAGATRIFGYTAAEMVGQSVKRIIPPELWGEEDDILGKLRRGERIDHFDTVRLAKDGSRVELSITVSPVRDRAGRIVGASKVAREIGERKRHEDMQRLLLEELNHRVKNTLATIQAIASQSLRGSASPADFVASFNGRVQALGRAHDLLVRSKMQGATLGEIVRDQVLLGTGDGGRVSCAGPDVTLDARLAVQLALVLHELATNARKYGALARPGATLAIAWEMTIGARGEFGRELGLEWKETGVPDLTAPRSRGFGTTLIERSLAANGGAARLTYEADGLRCNIRLPVPDERAAPPAGTIFADPGRGRAAARREAGDLTGKRVLIVEDEPLVAMDMEAELAALGLDVLGPVSTVAGAVRMIRETELDAALIDANLHGEPVERVAQALARKGVPFAFATGYGKAALPAAFRGVPVLAKPFDRQRLLATVRDLIGHRGQGAVVSLRPRSS